MEDIYYLKILNEYKQHHTFLEFDVNEFQTYCLNTYKYPISPFIQIVSMPQWAHNDTLNEYLEDLEYFTTIISRLYNNLYTQEEQQILITYLVLIHSDRLRFGVEEMSMNHLKNGLDTINSNKKEIQEIQKILKYNYTELLILYHIDKQEEIQLLLKDLEDNSPIFTIHDLLWAQED